MTPTRSRKTWIDETLDLQDTTGELWQWETMAMFHFKIPLEKIQSMDDETFFDRIARLKWIIEQEQKRGKANAGI